MHRHNSSITYCPSTDISTKIITLNISSFKEKISIFQNEPTECFHCHWNQTVYKKITKIS